MGVGTGEMDNGHAMTVQGPVPSSALGNTLIHEHLLIDSRPILAIHPYEKTSDEPLTIELAAEARWNPAAYPDNYLVDDVETVVEELGYVIEHGGSTVVDVTPNNLARDPDGLLEISTRTGLNVVMGSGYYLAGTHPHDVVSASAEGLAQDFISEWTEGVGPNVVRPGIIGELGTGDPLDPEEEKVLRAAAQASLATGLPVSIHVQPWGTEGARVLDVLVEEGLSADRVILGHMNTSIDNRGYQRELLEREANLGFDLMGFDHSLLALGRYPPSDHAVVEAITTLSELGFVDRIFVSQDAGAVKTRLVRYGGWGYGHLLAHVVPLFRSIGWSQHQIDTLLVENPARILTIPGLAIEG